MALKDIIFSVALLGAGYGMHEMVNRSQACPLPEKVQEVVQDPVRIVYVDKSTVEAYHDVRCAVQKEPQRFSGIINDMINTGYDLLPQADAYSRPEGVRSHEHPYHLRVIVLSDSMRAGNEMLVVARPYLYNSSTNTIKEIDEKEHTGSAFDLYSGMGRDAKEFIDKKMPFLKKGVGKVKDAGEKVIDSIRD